MIEVLGMIAIIPGVTFLAIWLDSLSRRIEMLRRYRRNFK